MSQVQSGDGIRFETELELAHEIIQERNETIKRLRAALYLADCKLTAIRENCKS